MQVLKQLRFNLWRRSRQATFHKQPFYPAIPYYYKPNYIDVHDTYTKRSKQQILAELKGKQFEINFERRIYNPTDIHKDEKQRKATAVLPIDQFNFTQLQMNRFKILVGPRYKQDKNQVKFSCQIHDSYEANMDKLSQQIYQVLLEAKRAP